MKMIHKLLSITVLYLINNVASQGAGESCIQDGVPGLCTVLGQCQSVLGNPKSQWWKLHRCGFQGPEPIICCVPSATTTTQRPVATTPKLGSSTTEYIPPVFDYQPSLPVEEGCTEPIPGVTAAKTGRKAWDIGEKNPERRGLATAGGPGPAERSSVPRSKGALGRQDEQPGQCSTPERSGSWTSQEGQCIEYKEELIYPCKQSVALSGSMNRVSNCRQNADGLIVGGKDASQNEFPHMVLLGFGQSSETAAWQCGGSLLSEKFILTAGHCTWARDLGPVTYAIVGSLRRSDKVDSSQVHRIQHIIKHPQYKAPSKYHDIALLETLLPVTLGASAVPVCLDIFGGNTSQAVATGWGATAWRGSDADILQKVVGPCARSARIATTILLANPAVKQQCLHCCVLAWRVTLTKFKEEECRKKFPRSRTMEHGFDADTQICYGDYTERVDTCQGDSGGPLTIQNAKVTCTYIIVGITSFGKSCGSPKDPGIYTKVPRSVNESVPVLLLLRALLQEHTHTHVAAHAAGGGGGGRRCQERSLRCQQEMLLRNLQALLQLSVCTSRFSAGEGCSGCTCSSEHSEKSHSEVSMQLSIRKPAHQQQKSIKMLRKICISPFILAILGVQLPHVFKASNPMHWRSTLADC
ncbi:hypothetical protein MSG28_014415 [Choristoneura fumiferana]|uniref:Uncharacterized protein n=1 Tax=Choristoneura fumiferana TaxID=7141 RepID=A0ACC0JRC7_CHOFU|nr:hypothetical protein MSG28_014415 [Choristoneura fumiferana]